MPGQQPRARRRCSHSVNVRATGEDDQLRLVLLQALDVGVHGRNAAVGAASINGDTDGLGQLAVDAGSLQLVQREATASAHTAVVAGGLAAHDGAQLVERARGDGGGLGGTGGTAGLLLRGLEQ